MGRVERTNSYDGLVRQAHVGLLSSLKQLARSGHLDEARKFCDELSQTSGPDGAGILSSITQSEGLVIVDEETSEVVPGMTVDFLPFSEVIG